MNDRRDGRIGMWICPVCRMHLHDAAGSLVCERGHSFDRARQGYVNLLLAHRKRTRSPGDAPSMLNSRRAFLDQGYYRPLAERLGALCAETLPGSDGDFALLDTGCGEGYYTCAIAEAMQGAVPRGHLWIGGIDIAKHAVGMAARRCGNRVEFAVASNAALPVADASLDGILRIFAPGYDAELTRCLKPAGRFIVVTPGPRHLFALRERVYRQPDEHPAQIRCPPGLHHLQRIELEFDLLVHQPDIADLLRMTPYFWKVPGERQQQIADMDSLDTEACFLIDIFRKESAAA